MTPFLQTLAEAYADTTSDLSAHLFVFPGRRAGVFFLKHLINAAKGRDIILPKVMTMTDFVEKICGKPMAGKIELLFILYQAYSGLLKDNGMQQVPEFDAFRRWGETAISDFNEVDMHDVDAESIFKNVKDLKEISSNFLTEEQLKVMNEFFGQAYDPENLATDFWKKFNDSEDGGLQSKFRLLWQVLSPLYVKYHATLEKKGLISSGGAYRLTADVLKRGWPSDFKINKVVMVGFNALTATERRIFDALSEISGEDGEPFAEYFWDATGPVISDRNSTAGRYVEHNKKRWPMPEWAKPYISKSDTDSLPENIRVISVPSNTMQIKVVSELLDKMSARIPHSDFDDAKVAVVLPDEQLLIPMLYSVPESIGDVNLTMGYPLRLSAAYTFVSLLRRMQTNRKKSGNVTGYYYKDFNMVLSHPFSRVLFGNAVSKVKEWIATHHRFIVDMMEIRDMCPLMASLFRPIDEDADTESTAAWLDLILKNVSDAFVKNEAKTLSNDVDIANISVYRQAIGKMLEVTEEYDVKMNWRTFLTLTERLLSSETVNFEGQPLRGLQVMGILETRALDFERIIIPSLNERILPARRRVRTFISDSLRKAYGLPPVNYSESLFAYYFFRMISRAKEVELLFDSRSSEGVKSGDVSRYVLQLKYMYARESLKIETRTFDISKSELHPGPIYKTPEIVDVLQSYLDKSEKGRNLSATSLTKYVNCQLRFYFEEILNIKTDEQSSEFIDSITQGSVIHDVMEAIYLPEDKRKIYIDHPIEITVSHVDECLKNVGRIKNIIRESINKRFYHLPEEKLCRPLKGSSAHVAKILCKQVLDILRFDRMQTPFLLFGVEIGGNVAVEIGDGKLVNMRYAIDRLDSQLQNIDGYQREIMRIVDYKTGIVHAKAASMQDVFDGNGEAKNILQIWLYANIFDALPDKNFDKKGQRPELSLFDNDSGLPKEPYALEFYELGKLSGGEHVYPRVAGKIQKDHQEHNSDFLGLLQTMLKQLFDINEPFSPPADENRCKDCPFKTICWR